MNNGKQQQHLMTINYNNGSIDNQSFLNCKYFYSSTPWNRILLFTRRTFYFMTILSFTVSLFLSLSLSSSLSLSLLSLSVSLSYTHTVLFSIIFCVDDGNRRLARFCRIETYFGIKTFFSRFIFQHFFPKSRQHVTWKYCCCCCCCWCCCCKCWWSCWCT